MEEEGDESKDLDTTSGAESAPLAGQDAAQTDPQQDKASRQKEFWPVEFADPPEPLAGIILRNLLFNILTLWIYRFWARTNVRRYLWRNMTVQGDALEYTGRGLELFLGFLLIAVTIFLPLFIISTVVQLLAGPTAIGFFTLVVYGLIVWLIGFGLFRARRYRLSRTLWRGVRASQSGSAREYGLRFLGYGILRVLSLGWFTPAANARLWAYRYNNSLAMSGSRSPITPQRACIGRSLTPGCR